MSDDVLTTHGDVRIVRGEGRVWVGNGGRAWEGGIALDGAALHWLVTTAGPAALHAIGAVPRLPDPIRDRDEREHARNVVRPLDAT